MRGCRRGTSPTMATRSARGCRTGAVTVACGRLTVDRVAALEALPGWTWDPIADDWQEGLAHLRAYVEREGHARVPRGTSPTMATGSGCGCRTGAGPCEGRLTDDRVAVLEALPGWSWDPIADDWQEGLAHLRAFVEREGHARVPAEARHRRWLPARAWVSHRREDRGRARSRTTGWRALEAASGLDVGPHRGRLAGGPCPPPRLRRARGSRAGADEARHRRRLPARDMGVEPAQGPWRAGSPTTGWRPSRPCRAGHGTPSQDAWQEGLAHLRAYVEREGHARVPRGMSPTTAIRSGTWVSNRRNGPRATGSRRPGRGARGPSGLDMGPHRGRLAGGSCPPPRLRRRARATRGCRVTTSPTMAFRSGVGVDPARGPSRRPAHG